MTSIAFNYCYFQLLSQALLCVLFLECQNYQILSKWDRKNTYRSEYTAEGVVGCDDHLGPAWFRFQGDAGTKMATSCVDEKRCGTHATGWLNGAHPTVNESKVTRKASFHHKSNCCFWSIDIEVRNCGDFYVYNINKTPSCSLGYCGSDWTSSGHVRYLQLWLNWIWRTVVLNSCWTTFVSRGFKETNGWF